MSRQDKRNPMGVPLAEWFPREISHQFSGMASPTAGPAACLIELYRGKSGSRDAETGVIWNRSEKFVHFSSNRGPDIVAVLKRVGDEGIVAFIPPISLEDELILYIKLARTRRAWAVVRVLRAAGDDDAEDEGADAGDEQDEAESQDEEEVD